MSAAARPRLQEAGAAGPDDALARKARFEAAHPGIVIKPPETHASLWKAHRNDRVVASGYMLASLMDVLERQAGEHR